jgi:dolichol-phosphate mannosyltransferase
VGLFVGSITFLLIFVYLLLRLTLGAGWPAGFATTTLLLLMSITLNALFLGIIGEYLGRVFMQAKHRPSPLVEAALNVAPTLPQAVPNVVRIAEGAGS